MTPCNTHTEELSGKCAECERVQRLQASIMEISAAAKAREDELLKQIPPTVEPEIFETEGNGRKYRFGRCNCGGIHLVGVAKACDECGAKLKWPEGTR